MSINFRIAGVSLLALASVLLTADISLAQPGRSGGNDGIWNFLSEKYDKNDDGKLSKKEYDRGKETFARLDRNEDGFLTAEDWSTARGSAGRRPSRTSGTGRGSRTPEVGNQAPDFDLTYVNEPSKSASLSSFAGKKPVALIFGSCT